jgi:ABC-type bacteriocin/lantibiotic exporter with double-glycine peptidase domain
MLPVSQCQKDALKDISFSIKNGEHIAILGVNGSGKTTLTKCIMGLYKQSTGHIIYNDKPLTYWNRDSFYDYATMISQSVIPYYLTLRENVCMSDISKKDDDAMIAKALNEIGLEELLDTPQKLDTQLGKEYDGIELSGGQWQKLALSRSLIKDSQFIIMDEPTSALDPLVETEILRMFLQVLTGKTAIIVSHRVGISRHVDRIFVMKDGAIVEMGSHDDLMSLHGEYHNLYISQQQWYT